jgi:predicted nucleic acid-binding protein
MFVDYFIGFESSLLKDTDASYRFRLPGRALILLENKSFYDSTLIYEFFNVIRKVRNRVIHSDAKVRELLERLSDNGKLEELSLSEQLSSREFNSRARYFLSLVILCYLDLHQKTGANMTQLNTQVLEPVMVDTLQSPVDYNSYLDDL